MCLNHKRLDVWPALIQAVVTVDRPEPLAWGKHWYLPETGMQYESESYGLRFGN